MNAQWRLLLLWISQAARVLVDGCLRIVAMLQMAGHDEQSKLTAFNLTTALFIAPFVLFAPLNGSLSNALPRRGVLVGSAAFALLAVAVWAAFGWHWIGCVVVVGLAAALNSAARYAVLPAAANDAGVALPRLSGWMDLGSAVALVASVAIGLALPHSRWPDDGLPLAWRAVAVLVGLNALCLLTALPAAFPTDLHRSESPSTAVAGFFYDLRRIATERSAGATLLALAVFQALQAAGAGALISSKLEAGKHGLGAMLPAIVLASIGTAVGSGVAVLIGHPRRCLGLVPPAALGMALSLVWALFIVSPDAPIPLVPALLLGFTGGLLTAPLRAAYLSAVPPDARGNGTSVMNTAIYSAVGLLTGLMVLLGATGVLASAWAQLTFITILTGFGSVVVGVLLFPQVLELLLAVIMAVFYRVRAHGPGAAQIPTTGPLLVICNHSAYLDPFWVGKVMPRKLTPMMTSVFYDKPGLRWLMRWVVGAIRVQASRFRREAPELDEGIRLLKGGGCLLLFPEAILRRDEEKLLRNFGQGVWRILREVPDTPVVVCWIEGGWGSYPSYKGGPPFVGKKVDFARPIDIAIAAPEVLPQEILSDQRKTREYLMWRCLGCRGQLGLEVPTMAEMAEEDDPELTGTLQDRSGNPHLSNAECRTKDEEG